MRDVQGGCPDDAIPYGGALRAAGLYGDCTVAVKTQSTDPLLSEQQAAQILGIQPATLQVWRCTRRYPLQYVKVGRTVRYRRSAVEEFISLRTVAA